MSDEALLTFDVVCERCGNKATRLRAKEKASSFVCEVCHNKWLEENFNMKIISIDGVEQKRDNE
jgi:formylmethanofuran dehydrogenase subunit E